MLELNFLYHAVAQKLYGLHVWLYSIFKKKLQAFDIAYF